MFPFRLNRPSPVAVSADRVAPTECEPPDYSPDEEVATRGGYGTGLAKLGTANPDVVALDGDTKNSTYAEQFMTLHPDRYFEMFIAEQNLVGAGIGLSKRGENSICLHVRSVFVARLRSDPDVRYLTSQY